MCIKIYVFDFEQANDIGNSKYFSKCLCESFYSEKEVWTIFCFEKLMSLYQNKFHLKVAI